MLTEQRYEIILNMLEKNKSVTVTQLKTLMNVSESTVRRDITALHNAGRLIKVFGGAIAAEGEVVSRELTVEQKENVNCEEKKQIAKYAASIIEPDDFVFIDAGTTTAYMIDYITQKNATYVTNAVLHARRLAAAGLRVFLTGGELKGSTEAVIGTEAVSALERYHFVKGFFGANGITLKAGFTTPDVHEASVKKAAMLQCRKSYILADSSKFGSVASVTFAPFYSSKIITDTIPEDYADCKNIIQCKK